MVPVFSVRWSNDLPTAASSGTLTVSTIVNNELYQVDVPLEEAVRNLARNNDFERCLWFNRIAVERVRRYGTPPKKNRCYCKISVICSKY